jgi:peptidyl-prolyl cis-trans isomerase C
MRTDPPPYLALKLAHALFGKAPTALDDAETKRLHGVAARQQEIERRILSTDKAACVVLPESSVDASCDEIRQRYASQEEFQADLERQGLPLDALRDAIRRDLVVEAVLEHVASQSAEVNATDVEIFYLLHSARFQAPERRRLRHILITINDELPDNTRAKALERIEAVRARCLKAPERFAEQALKHSECPTALNGGLLGDVPAGQLFPALDPVAFALKKDQLSAVAESPLGFHLLRCDAILPAGTLPLEAVREKIHQHLLDSRRRLCQKAWISELLQPAETK